MTDITTKIKKQPTYKEAEKDLLKKRNPEKKKVLERFFKTGVGEYGEGDLFLGVVVPETREVAKRFKGLMLKDIQELLRNKYHEVRLCGFLMLVQKYEEARGNNSKKTLRETSRENSRKISGENSREVEEIVSFYLKNLKFANNWDLVDLSCYKILGDYLVKRKEKRKILYKLIKSKNMWERRVGIISCMALIKNNDLDDVFLISEQLLTDEEDLMHKAVGWMLREAGKKDEKRLKNFLRKHIKKMPRVTLRYAIEKFEEEERKTFLKI